MAKAAVLGFVLVLGCLGSGCSSSPRNFGSGAGGGGAGADAPGGGGAAGSHSPVGGGTSPGGASNTAGSSDSDAEAGAAGSSRMGDGGGGEQGSVPEAMPGAPTVISVSPLDQNKFADPLKPVVLKFSEPLDPKTVSADSVQIKGADGAVVTGTLNCVDATVTFTPEARLNLLEAYELDVTTAVADVDGTRLAQPFSSTFTVRDGVWGTEGAIPSTAAAALLGGELQLASDGAGHALAVWDQSGKPNGVVTDIVGTFFDPSSGWGAPKVITTSTDQSVSDTTVSMNEKGDAVVAWAKEDSVSGNTVQTRRYIRGVWDATPTRVDNAVSPQSVFYVGATITSTGSVHVTWTSYDSSSPFPYSLYTRHVTPSGVWDVQPLAFVLGEAAESSLPAMAFDANGDGFAVYRTATNPAVVYGKRYLDASATWTGSAIPSATADSIYSTYLALDSSGGAMALWVGVTEGASSVVASRYDKGWKTPVPVSTETGYATNAALTWTGKSFVAAWAQFSGTANNVNANEFTSAWSKVSVLSDGDHSAASIPIASADPRGNAVVAWMESSDSVLPDFVFARLVGSSDTWLPAAPTESTLGRFNSPLIAVQKDGTALSAWQTLGQVGQTLGFFSNSFR